ncbi:hypothetical protein DCCM_0369 [Desulfocucumis palustris]|uniref:Uncharacterized protein n=1 Tax=Desulfocucumis palustris TaxID=1898651 RepID=A0A2L2X7V0_9FIRM|nr:hypothetical protein DCCM_0369 [Desulfocucumis palustris]
MANKSYSTHKLEFLLFFVLHNFKLSLAGSLNNTVMLPGQQKNRLLQRDKKLRETSQILFS